MDRRTRQALITQLRTDAYRIASRFGLRYRAIQPERANVKRRYGVCFSDGEIRIRLANVTTGEPLKYSSLVNTLCHELAHLKHFHHGEPFRAYYQELLAFARAEGIYVPAATPRRAPRRLAPGRGSPRPAEGPEQLGLFGSS
ncbi:MAG: M48 family metallopeptidase [Myxococcales bacterium]|nr:M48 family metallopeptidase [Myxococcales bacterium]